MHKVTHTHKLEDRRARGRSFFQPGWQSKWATAMTSGRRKNPSTKTNVLWTRPTNCLFVAVSVLVEDWPPCLPQQDNGRPIDSVWQASEGPPAWEELLTSKAAGCSVSFVALLLGYLIAQLPPAKDLKVHLVCECTLYAYVLIFIWLSLWLARLLPFCSLVASGFSALWSSGPLGADAIEWIN